MPDSTITEKTRGFITIATGEEKYYRFAVNLLMSYRLYCPNPMPFAIMCDQKIRIQLNLTRQYCSESLSIPILINLSY